MLGRRSYTREGIGRVRRDTWPKGGAELIMHYHDRITVNWS
jgi:hypothetical protein